MATVMYTTQPSGAPQLDFTEVDDDDPSLTAFLTPKWRYDQENMAHDAMTYQQTGFGIDPDWSLYTDDKSLQYNVASDNFGQGVRVASPSGGDQHTNPENLRGRGLQQETSSHSVRQSSQNRPAGHENENGRITQFYVHQEQRLSYASIVSKPPPPVVRNDSKLASLTSTQQGLDEKNPRRSSITSVSSVTSTKTDISKPKLSLSKRIRKVFSLNSISNRYADDAASISSDVSATSSPELGSSVSLSTRSSRMATPFSGRPASALGYHVQNGVEGEDDEDDDEDIPVDAYRKENRVEPSRIVPPRSGTPQPMLRRRSLVNLGSLFSSDKQQKTDAVTLDSTKGEKTNQKQQKDSPTPKRSFAGIHQRGATSARTENAPSRTGKSKGSAKQEADASTSNEPKNAKPDAGRGILKPGKDTQISSTKAANAGKITSVPGRIPRPVSRAEPSAAPKEPHSRGHASPFSQPLFGQDTQESPDVTNRNLGSNCDDSPNSIPPSPPHHHQIIHYRSTSSLVSGLDKPELPRQSSVPDQRTIRRIQFNKSVEFYDAHSANEYDRRCDPNVTCAKLTPLVAMKIKQELNEYKLKEMDVHIDSRMYTHFFL